VHNEYCIAKVVCAPVSTERLNRDLIDNLTARLWEKSAPDAQALRQSIGEISGVGMIFDITEQVRGTALDRAAGAQNEHGIDGLSGWCGRQRVVLESGEVVEQLDEGHLVMPATTYFGYVERRREDRFHAKSSVNIKHEGKLARGVTVDISTRGLRVQLEEALDAAVGDTVHVHLVSLQKKRPSLDLKNIAYRVVGIRHAPQTNLMLERVVDAAESDIRGFFLELINKNKDKLKLDTEDVRNATTAVLYSSLLGMNLVSLPFFIGKNEEGVAQIFHVAVTESPCELADFLRTDEGGYDFSMIADLSLQHALYNGALRLRMQADSEQCRQSPDELEIYMYKERDGESGQQKIRAWTSLAFADAGQRETVIRHAMAQTDYRFVKLVVTYTLPLEEQRIELITDIVRENSRVKAMKLREEVHNISAVGEIFDITDQVTASQS
jgi:hypothetical protein